MPLCTPYLEPTSQPHGLPQLVLDTQVLMDWLVFRDPACAALDQAIRGHKVVWVSSADTLAECEHVLSRGVAAAWQPDLPRLRDTWQALSWQQDPPPPLPPAWQGLRCSDPDDQKFINLALACRADWLLSRDKAVLRLARKTRPLGLQITTLAHWSARPSAGAG